MALITCPGCKKQVSDKAKTCYKCGFPIKNIEITPKEIKLKQRRNDKILLLVFLVFIILAIIVVKTSNSSVAVSSNLDGPTPPSTYSYTDYAVSNENKSIEDVSVLKKDWRSAGANLPKISKILAKNNITGCGEYYIYEITRNEFALACTPDGVNWTYYVIYPNLDKLYLANEKMRFQSPF